MPFTDQLSPVLLVPLTVSAKFKLFPTRTVVPELGCMSSATCPGATFSETCEELADPGSGLVTAIGYVPGLGAVIEAASSVDETNVVGTAAPFQNICAP